MLACVRRARLRKAIRFTPICCVGCAWTGPTKSGAPTSPIYRCGEAFCIWLPSFARQGYAQHDPERVGWHSRKVLAWRKSNTLEAELCVDALNEAIHKFGLPQIMNTDQGNQFISFAWTDRLRRSRVRIPPLMHVNMHCRAVDGRQGALSRQHICRTTVAVSEIRVRLSACLGDRVRS
jgi:putative transposase